MQGVRADSRTHRDTHTHTNKQTVTSSLEVLEPSAALGPPPIKTLPKPAVPKPTRVGNAFAILAELETAAAAQRAPAPPHQQERARAQVEEEELAFADMAALTLGPAAPPPDTWDA
jgi:hypothetical protein